MHTFKLVKILFFILRYRLFFLFSFIPYLGLFKIFLNLNSIGQAKRLTIFLERLGPCFIKLGQILSVRADLVGEVFAKSLSNLQENNKKADFKKLSPFIIEALGYDIYNSIKNFPKHLAAIGSIAEVFKIVLPKGEQVAVKVLRPNIRVRFKSDIEFLRKIFSLAQKKFKEGQRLKLLKVIDLLEKISNFELDLRFEAVSAEEQRESLNNNIDVYIPKIYWDYSTKDVLVTEWLSGSKIYELPNLTINKKKDIIFKLYKLFFIQVIKFGFFHGDLHPGNIVVSENNSISLLDFGIIGNISYNTRQNVYKLWKAFLNQDYETAASIHFQAGWVNDKYNKEDLIIAIRAIIDPIFKKKKSKVLISGLMEQLFEISRMFGMEIQSDLLLIQKNMFLLEGIARALAPEVNIWYLSRDIINSDYFESNLESKIKNKYNNINRYGEEILTLFYKKLKNDSSKRTYYINKSTNKDTLKYVIILFLCVIIVMLIWKVKN